MNPINRDQRLSVVTKVVLFILLAVVSFFVLGRFFPVPRPIRASCSRLTARYRAFCG